MKKRGTGLIKQVLKRLKREQWITDAAALAKEYFEFPHCQIFSSQVYKKAFLLGNKDQWKASLALMDRSWERALKKKL